MSNGNQRDVKNLFEVLDGESDGEEQVRPLETGPDPDTLFAALDDPLPIATGIGLTPGQEFVEGVGAGILAPLGIFGIKPDELPEDIEARRGLESKIAGGIGEFVGFGISFVPAFRLSGLAVRSVGALSRLPPYAQRITQSALAFGGFEAGRLSEDISDVPEEFLKGAALGAAGDIALIGLGKAFGRLFGKGRTSPLGDIEKIEPDNLQLLRQLLPNEGDKPTQMLEKLLLISDPEEQLDDLIVKAMKVRTPTGFFIVPGIQNPKRFRAAVKRNFPDAVVEQHFQKETKTWKMLVAEDRVVGARLVELIKLRSGLMSIDEAAELMAKGSPPLEPPVNIKTNAFKSAFNVIRRLGSTQEEPFIWVEPPEVVQAFMNKLSPEVAVMAAATHEYSHYLATRLAFQSGKVPQGFSPSGPLRSAQTFVREDIRVVLDSILEPEDLATLRPNLKELRPADVDKLKGLNKELAEASIAAEQIRSGETREWLINNLMWEDASLAQYFGNGQELFARLIELMYTNPKRAAQVAPKLTKAVAQAIEDNSPTLSAIFENRRLENVNSLLSALWVRTGERTRPFGIQPLVFGKKAKGSNIRGQFRQFGHFKGEAVQSPEGEWWEIRKILTASKDKNVLSKLNDEKLWGRDIGPGEPYVRVRHQRSGLEVNASFDAINSPTLAKTVQSNQVLRGLAARALNNAPRSLVVTLRMPDEEAVRKAVVNLEGFERVKSLDEYWRANARELREFQQAKGIVVGGAPPAGQQGTRVGQAPLIPSDPNARHRLLAEYLKSQGRKGLVINEDAAAGTLPRGEVFPGRPLPTTAGGPRPEKVDKQFMSVLIADDRAVQFHDEVISIGLEELERSGMAIDGVFREGVPKFLRLSNTSRVNSIIAENRIDPRDTEYFKELLRQVTSEELLGEIDDDMRQALQAADEAIQSFGTGQGADDAVRRIENTRVEQAANGDWLVLDADGAVIAAAPTREELGKFTKAGAPQAVKNLDESAQVTTDHVPGNAGGIGKAPNYQAQLSVVDEGTSKLDQLNLVAPIFSGFEKFAQSVENAGFGPAWSRVFEPLQNASLRVAALMNDVPRPALDGKSINKFLKDNIQKRASKLSSERQNLLVNMVEYLTAEEIARPGGFLRRGMNSLELSISRKIQQLGTAHDIPRLLSVRRLGERRLKSQADFNIKANRIINDPQTPPETKQVLQRIRDSEVQFSNLSEVYDAAGLTSAQKQTLGLLDQGLGVDDFSILAVSRHAAADKLQPQFKSGREQFKAKHNITALEESIVKDLDRILEMGFDLAGLNAKRHVGGYWPHLRQFMLHGIDTTDQIFRRELPKFTTWTHERLRTGELDVYNMDPVLVPMKYLRSLFVNRELSPLLPDAQEVIAGIREGAFGKADVRVARIMTEYVNEIMGRPHQSFERLNQAFRTLLRTTNAPAAWQANSRFGEALVNAMVSLTAGATIPFRAGLLLRNYFQVYQMVPAVTGHRDFWSAVGKTIGWGQNGFDRRVMQEAKLMAEKAQAVQKHTIPLEASTEIFGGPNALLGPGVSKLGPGAKQLRDTYRYLVDKGFAWYQSADDWGRAVAFHAQRDRIKRFQTRFESGKLSWDEFATKIKLKTYNQTEVQRFTDLYKAGRQEEAINFLGKQNARRTIFRYGHSNHPAGWGGVPGRLFGQFGTWPVQYKDFVLEGITRGTTKDKAEFIAHQVAANSAVLGGGAALGLNLASWLTFPSIQYVGGPYVDITMDLAKAIGGSDAERSLALGNLKYQINPLEDGRSLLIPGSYFAGDVVDAFEEGNIIEAFGVNVARPNPDKTWLDHLMTLVTGRQ